MFDIMKILVGVNTVPGSRVSGEEPAMVETLLSRSISNLDPSELKTVERNIFVFEQN